MHITTDDGVRLHAEIETDNGEPPLLFCNALGTSLGLWDDQVQALRGRFRLIRFDARGHGASEAPPGPYSVGRFGADARAVLDAAGIARASIVGLSLGGQVAGWLAAHAPDRVARLAICCSTPHAPPASLWIERAAAVRETGTAPLVETILGRWFSPDFAARRPEAVERIRRMLLANPREGYAASCEALASMDQRPDLARIAAPTLVVAGETDPAATPEKARDMATLIPDATVYIIPRASHLANVEEPAIFNDALLHFLER